LLIDTTATANLSEPQNPRECHLYFAFLYGGYIPQSQFIGYDFHAGLVEAAKAHAREHNVTNVEFHLGTAKAAA
jgi:hypothetical protein